LKWDQGVASRGNLKGNALPVKRNQNEVSVINRKITYADKPNGLGHKVVEHLAFANSQIPPQLNLEYLQSSEEKRLVHHYDMVVAPNMAWADWSENPWRNIIIPLAFQSPPLLNAILAFAAKHMNALASSEMGKLASIVPSRTSDILQERAMVLLAQEIRKMAMAGNAVPSTGSNVAHETNRNALLATMLVLCNVETVWPGKETLIGLEDLLTPLQILTSGKSI
jgi:hypothetical protein